MNIMKVLSDAVKPFLDDEKPPLNVGEVMNLWFYYAATEQTMRGEQVSYNIVRDHDLKEMLKEVLNDIHGPILKELTEFLTAEGVQLPEKNSGKPIGEFQNIPEGSKLTDEEVANLLSFNIVQGIIYACSISLRDLLMKRGWLKVPPHYTTEVRVKS